MSVMIFKLVSVLSFLLLVIIYHTKAQEELQPTDLSPNVVLKALQPPPLTSPDGEANQSVVREKRCGGGGGGCCGGGCSQPAPAKVINIQIQVKKAPARHPPRMVHRPPPMMVHRPAPMPVAYVPVAVVPVTYVKAAPAPMCCPAPRPAPMCCGGGGGGGYGGGGGGGKWKGK